MAEHRLARAHAPSGRCSRCAQAGLACPLKWPSERHEPSFVLPTGADRDLNSRVTKHACGE
eukprot:3055986-Pleurochrysis_carterae.AAC.1